MIKSETDIVLCKITDVKSKEKVMYALMKAGIPYAEEWEKVPLVKRKKYHGAKEACVVITHRAKAEEAKKIVDLLDQAVKQNIVW